MYLGKLTSSNEVQKKICELLLGFGSQVSPRGMSTLEALGVSFELTCPRNRRTSVRKWDPALAIGELAWHLRGESKVEPLAHYAPRWRDFADSDGQVRESCYGARIFKSQDGQVSQWNQVKKLLIQDDSSRRGVLSFRTERNVSVMTNDLSCTNTMQFICRDSKLHAFVNMRSNDVIWGVPYDVFLFTSLQELMAAELGVELGTYYHSAASMHVYQKHIRVAEKVARSNFSEDGGMAPISSCEDMRKLAEIESGFRSGGKFFERHELTPFQLDCVDMMAKGAERHAA